MNRGFADEAVLVVKQGAYEGVVTYLRIKLTVSGASWRRRVEHATDGATLIRSDLLEACLLKELSHT